MREEGRERGKEEGSKQGRRFSSYLHYKYYKILGKRSRNNCNINKMLFFNISHYFLSSQMYFEIE